MADLSEDILSLAYSCQALITDSEKQKVEDLRNNHQANLAMISSRIGSIDEQISHLQSQREILFSKRDQELKNIAVLKSILSPIRRVPTDVLGEIFLFCLPEASVSWAVNVLRADEAPLLLCQVCLKWRRTALDFPPLWKALVLRVTYADAIPTIVETWFARAGGCLLSLGLCLPKENVDPLVLTVYSRDILVGLPNSRLQHLSLSGFYGEDMYFISGISQEFTALQSFCLLAEIRDSNYFLPPDRLLQSAPRLRSVVFRNFTHQSIFPNYWIPWSQLTHLEIEDQLSENMWFNVICHCKNLQHGIFKIDLDVKVPLMIPTSDHEIILPHLVHLTIRTRAFGGKPIFRQLAFPALKQLELLYDWKPTSIQGYLWDNGRFPRTNTSSLTSFVLAGDILIIEPEMQSLLKSLPSVTELDLSVVTNYYDFFTTLTNTRLLPTLEALRCDIRRTVGHKTVIKQRLVSFVKSRHWDQLNSSNIRIARLRRLTLKFPAHWNFVDDVGQFLAPFRGRGLLLVLDTTRDR